MKILIVWIVVVVSVIHVNGTMSKDELLSKLLERRQQSQNRDRLGKFDGAGDLGGWSWGTDSKKPISKIEQTMERLHHLRNMHDLLQTIQQRRAAAAAAALLKAATEAPVIHNKNGRDWARMLQDAADSESPTNNQLFSRYAGAGTVY